MKHDHCVACGQSGNLHQHHLVPRSIGGSDDETNLLTLCGSCHAKAHSVQAEWRHSELTKAALGAKKARGERIGTINFGYSVNTKGKLVENKLEQLIISAIKDYRGSGMSLRNIVTKLNEQDYVSRSGKPLCLTQVARIVKQPTLSKEQPQ